MIDMLQKDELTGLPNRKKIENEVTRLILEKTPFYLVHIDFDNFKYINDTLSYSIGDEFLKLAGQVFKRYVQQPHMVGRLGGDEFAFLFKSISREELEKRLLTIFDFVSLLAGKNHQYYFFSVSTGIVEYPGNGETNSDLFKHADIAMQKAKREGKGRWVFYMDEILKNNTDNVKMAQQLQFAIRNDGLTLHYQPKFNLMTGKITGIEALIRWFHKEKGAISPGKFIPLAEETGQIYQIEKWVMTKVLSQKKNFEEKGFSGLEMSVNLSSKTLMSDLNFSEIEELIASFNIDFTKITIEITETAALTDSKIAIERLNKLKRLGIKLALDDFGTGYSSLTYLKILPIDYVKLDRSFVKSIEENSKDALIIKSILDLASDLNYRVVAEGIETRSQLTFLKKNNCETGQGFLLGRPQPIEKLETAIKRDFSLSFGEVTVI